MRKAALVAAVFVAAAITTLGAESAHAQTNKPKSKVVIVESGDTLSKIARHNDTTYQRIYYANLNVKHPDKIYPEDKLRIPRKDEKLKKRIIPGTEAPATATPQPRSTESYQRPAPRPRPQPVARTQHAVTGSVWDRLAACESGGNWAINTGNGYYGGLQFSLATWRSVGGSGYPHQASRSEQIKRGQILQARSGWGQWPACSAKLGLR